MPFQPRLLASSAVPTYLPEFSKAIRRWCSAWRLPGLYPENVGTALVAAELISVYYPLPDWARHAAVMSPESLPTRYRSDG